MCRLLDEGLGIVVGGHLLRMFVGTLNCLDHRIPPLLVQGPVVEELADQCHLRAFVPALHRAVAPSIECRRKGDFLGSRLRRDQEELVVLAPRHLRIELDGNLGARGQPLDSDSIGLPCLDLAKDDKIWVFLKLFQQVDEAEPFPLPTSAGPGIEVDDAQQVDIELGPHFRRERTNILVDGVEAEHVLHCLQDTCLQDAYACHIVHTIAASQLVVLAPQRFP